MSVKLWMKFRSGGVLGTHCSLIKQVSNPISQLLPEPLPTFPPWTGNSCQLLQFRQIN